MIARALFFFLTLAAACYSNSSNFTPSPDDLFCFGKMWSHLGEYQEEQKLYAAIAERRAEVHALKLHWKWRLDACQEGTDRDFYQKIHQILETGTLKRLEDGSGAAHLLNDETGTPRFILKPLDGEILCLNNTKCYGNPLNEVRFRARPHIPLYHSVQTDALVYACASRLGISSIAPKTVMDIIASDVFYDLSERLEGTTQEEFFLIAGSADRERLCSVQEYIPHSQEFTAWYRVALSQGFSHEHIAGVISQEDFENIHLLIWIIYDNDAHPANIRVIEQEDGHVRLMKVDNTLSFPEKNTHLLNTLSLLPNAHEKLSLRGQELVASLPVDTIVDLLEHYEMEYAVTAFLERVRVLQELAQRDLTLREIDECMEHLERK
ncbi:MAG TPA: hypothetical protein VIJ46_05675 [Rhabdochlamydiaceae bacterium]